MKKILPILLIFIGIITAASSCNNRIKSEGMQDEETHQESHVDSDRKMILHTTEEDCHGVRKTILSVEDEVGEIMLIGEHVTISIPPGNRRYKICEAMKELKVEGLKVKFSGLVLETFPNERLMGTPLRLRSIDVVK